MNRLRDSLKEFAFSYTISRENGTLLMRFWSEGQYALELAKDERLSMDDIASMNRLFDGDGVMEARMINAGCSCLLVEDNRAELRLLWAEELNGLISYDAVFDAYTENVLENWYIVAYIRPAK